jgi:hypothetical protein
MLWLVMKGQSEQIIACNIYNEKGVHQLWVERANGKTRKIKESKSFDEVNEVKEAIDYAIREGHKSLELA